MKVKSQKKLSSFILCMMMIVAMAFMTTGCNDTNSSPADENATANKTAAANEAAAVIETAAANETAAILGEGSTNFTFTVTDADGSSTQFEIHTDKTTVGEALLELGLIDGDDSEYGLYVTTVNGITVDYDTDGKYWAFYVDGEYATTGVDTTAVTAGSTYLFKAEK